MDHMRMAKELYHQQAKGHFKLESAWEILCHHPKLSGVESNESRFNPSTSSIPSLTSSPAPSDSTISRPKGMKAAKRRRHRSTLVSDAVGVAVMDRIIVLKHANELTEQQNQMNAQQHALALRHQDLAEKQLAIEEQRIELVRKKTEAAVSQANLAIIMQSEMLCPDDESKDMLRLLKRSVKAQLCPMPAVDSNIKN